MNGGGSQPPNQPTADPSGCGFSWVCLVTTDTRASAERSAQHGAPESFPAVWAVLARAAPGGHKAPNCPFLPMATECHHVLADVQGCGWWVSVAPAMAGPPSHLPATWMPHGRPVCHHLAPSVSTLVSTWVGPPAGPPPSHANYADPAACGHWMAS